MVLQPFSSTPASGACFANVAKKHTSKRIYSQVLTQQLEYCKAEITVRLTRLQGSQLEPETSAYQHMLPQQWVSKGIIQILVDSEYAGALQKNHLQRPNDIVLTNYPGSGTLSEGGSNRPVKNHIVMFADRTVTTISHSPSSISARAFLHDLLSSFWRKSASEIQEERGHSKGSSPTIQHMHPKSAK
ncbi:hypothetical protein BASA61_002369 [Batrachochytrium salamandrivorans]|nr:hypothetical protein BASA61_002369 [Batrachochytrium salamandrivorans]